jgi:hypothetical protein
MNDSQEKELSIDTPEGLAEFLRFIEDAYGDFVVALQHTHGAEVMVSGDLLKVETARSKAVELVSHHTKILEFGGELYQEDIEELQSLYDIIAAAYDRLTQAGRDVVPSEEAYAAIEETGGLDATLERAKILAVHIDELVYEFSELETAKITTAELKLGKLLYEQLKTVAKSALGKVEEIEQLTVMASPQEILHIAGRIDGDLDSLTETAAQLQKSLLRFFNTDAFQDQTPERKNLEEKSKKDERAAKLFDQPSIFTDIVKVLLKETENRTILQERHSSPAAFEASLKREVYRVEAPSRLDALLGVKYTSAFSFLKDMTLVQIDTFDGGQSREQIREILQEKNIPYETYMAWIQAMSYMESLVVAHDDMTFMELFIRSEIEMLRNELETKRNSQGVHNR